MNQLDWGPKPFRTLDYWFQDRGYVEENWKNVTVHGRGAFILKEKLKRLKIK